MKQSGCSSSSSSSKPKKCVATAIYSGQISTEGSSFQHFPVSLPFTFFLFYVCVGVGEQGSCLLHLDLNTALKLHSCERPAALPGYPNTMCSICKPLHKAQTVFQLLFSLCEN